MIECDTKARDSPKLYPPPAQLCSQWNDPKSIYLDSFVFHSNYLSSNNQIVGTQFLVARLC